ncbi:MAG: hypothetical protein FWH02_04290 [Oscillospiraceae bacterium]|nr:hypothetical protein [Oscillospiraceae bacterium]
MTAQSKKLMQWAINKIKTEYPDDVALLVAVEGASVNGDGHGEPFDYFVPATDRGNQLSQTFIIGDVGNDLYPRSWERCERTANLDDPAAICLGKAKILYARSKEDEERFEAIRQKLFDNLADPVFVYKKALENLDVAMDMYRTMMFEERLWKVRCLAGFVHHFLFTSVACLNGDYWKDWHFGALAAIAQWEGLPERFGEYYCAVMEASTVSELRNIAHLLIASARQFIARYKPESTVPAGEPDYRWLAAWYQELRTTWNRLYYFCEQQNSDAAFIDACNLQNELSIIADEFALGELDLLGAFDVHGLRLLSARACELEKTVVRAIEEKGVKIKRYATTEEFLAANL